MSQVESQRLQVVYWPIEKLIPFARNPRTHSEEQINQIAASIREFSWTNPVLIDPDGVIIAGQVKGDVRPLLDWRGALAGGAVIGLLLGILRRR